MKIRKWIHPALFTLGGALAGGVSQKLCKRTRQCKKRVKRGGEQRS